MEFIGVMKILKQFKKLLCMTLKLESNVQYTHKIIGPVFFLDK